MIRKLLSGFFRKETWIRLWWLNNIDFDKDLKTKLAKDDVLPIIISLAFIAVVSILISKFTLWRS